MIVGLQITGLIFAFAMLYFALIHYKKGDLNGVEMFFWSVIWLGVIIIILFPDLIRVFAKTFVFARLFDMLVFGGFILVIFLSAKSYITTKKLERKLEDFIRKSALTKSAKKV